MRYRLLPTARARRCALHPRWTRPGLIAGGLIVATLAAAGPVRADAVAYLEGKGVKLLAMQKVYGLDAYLGEAPDGAISSFYVTPDGQGVIAGILFDDTGRNITLLQIQKAVMDQAVAETRLELLEKGDTDSLAALERHVAEQEAALRLPGLGEEAAAPAAAVLAPATAAPAAAMPVTAAPAAGAPPVAAATPEEAFPVPRYAGTAQAPAAPAPAAQAPAAQAAAAQAPEAPAQAAAPSAAEAAGGASGGTSGSLIDTGPPALAPVDDGATQGFVPRAAESTGALANGLAAAPSAAAPSADPAAANGGAAAAAVGGATCDTCGAEGDVAQRLAGGLALPDAPLASLQPDPAAAAPAVAPAAPAAGGAVVNRELAKSVPFQVPPPRNAVTADAFGSLRQVRRGPLRDASVTPEVLAPLPVAEQVLRAAGETFWFSWGNEAAPVVYMVADPNCPYCHEGFDALAQPVAAGRINLRIIMVATLDSVRNGTSSALSASILDNPDPVGAFKTYNGVAGAEPGAFSAESHRQVGINQSFLDAFQITGTPQFLFRDGATGEAVIIRGLPNDVIGQVVTPATAQPTASQPNAAQPPAAQPNAAQPGTAPAPATAPDGVSSGQ